MVDKIEMSLDDIIKSNRGQNRKPQGGNRGGGGGNRRGGGAAGNRGPQRQGGRRVQTSPRKPGGSVGGGVLKGRGAGGIQKAKFSRGDVNSAWKHDMYDGPKRGILKTTDSAKLLVSNLDYGVSDSDIRELFTEFGPLKKAAVHYDRSGRSLGTADVVFERRSDALKAIKQYNGVPLDGRPMNIQFLTDAASITRPVRTASGPSPQKRRPQVGGGGAGANRRGGAAGGNRRGGPANRNRQAGGGGGAAAGGRNNKKTAPTAEELDAELDAYVNDMKI